jgi:hypothetical protein
MGYALSRPDIRTVIMAAAWQNYLNLSADPNAGPNGHGFVPGQLERELDATPLQSCRRRASTSF